MTWRELFFTFIGPSLSFLWCMYFLCHWLPKKQAVRHTVWDYLSSKRPLPDDRSFYEVVSSRVVLMLAVFIGFAGLISSTIFIFPHFTS